MLVHRRVTHNIKFAGTHLYTWVKRGTVRVKCIAHEHNAMSSARSRTRTARSGVEGTNHVATAPPTLKTIASTNVYHKMMLEVSNIVWYSLAVGFFRINLSKELL